MQVRQIDTTSRRDVDRFVNLAFNLYADSPLWVPPLVSSVYAALDRRKHPFYQHSDADFFLAERDGHVVGRLAAMENRNYNAFHHSRSAYFGYFEVADDLIAAQALFDAAFDWARARGLEEMIGPRGVLGTDSGGILIEGFEHQPALGVPYNPPYYDAFITACGFEKDTDYISGHIPAAFELPARFFRVADKVMERRGYWIKHFQSKRELRRWVPRLVEAHRIAFSGSHTYYPPTPDELQMIIDTILTIADPSLLKLVMQEKEVVGFVFIYHDIAAGLKKAHGRLWPFGWFHILSDKRRTRLANGNGLGVLPAHQGLGANAVLYTELTKMLRASQFERLELVQIEERNMRSLAEMRNVKPEWYKVHRGYKRAL